VCEQQLVVLADVSGWQWQADHSLRAVLDVGCNQVSWRCRLRMMQGIASNLLQEDTWRCWLCQALEMMHHWMATGRSIVTPLLLAVPASTVP